MVRVSVLNDALKTMYNAEKRGKRQVLLRPSSKVVIKFLQVMQRHGEPLPPPRPPATLAMLPPPTTPREIQIPTNALMLVHLRTERFDGSKLSNSGSFEHETMLVQ